MAKFTIPKADPSTFPDRIASAPIKLEFDVLDRYEAKVEELADAQEAARNSDVEINPKSVVIKMLMTAPKLDQEFEFKTLRFGGEAFVQAMRMVLTRARKVAQNEKQQLRPFKLLLVSIEHFPTYDLVKVVRTERSSLKQKSTYDDIIRELSTENGESNVLK